MPLQSKPIHQGNGLCLLSIDAGGSRAISQLKILVGLMHRFNYDAKEDEKQRPCDVFDMIGGTGSGGFIAVLLVVFKLTADQALDEFIGLTVNILDSKLLVAKARTAALETYIDTLLKKYEVARSRRLLESTEHPESCKLMVPISYKNNLGHSCVLRNFETRQEQTTNLTIGQALLATLATPPLFTPTSITKDFSTFEYIGGDLTLSNPVHKIISEAHAAFGPDEHVACILSVGCGHAGVIPAPEGSDIGHWNQTLETLIKGSEQKAHELDTQIGHLGIYYRLRVTQGLQGVRTGKSPGEILSHTAVYLSDVDVSRKVDLSVDSLKKRDGIASLEQLKRSGGEPLIPMPLPPLTKTFVMRKKPWEFIEKAMLGTEETDGPRMLAVTGIGGCGKTQLILKFMRVHKSKFESLFFIDGSSASRIRADILRHARSLGSAHSQKTFEECLLFLSHPTSERPRLLVYDNVDDPDVDLLPLLPDGEGCSFIITSRNRSIGALSTEAHLELDKMTMDEAVELLLQADTRSAAIDEQHRKDAMVISEALGCLPIALQQARSYMYQSRCSGTTYLERLSHSRDKLLSQPVKYQKDMRYLSTYAAFQASFDRLPLREQKLLRLLSFLHWRKFPLELIILAAKHKFSEYDQAFTDHDDEVLAGKSLLEELFLIDGEWNPTHLDDLMVSLQTYSLVTVITGVDTLLVEMHPLLHGWLQSSISKQEQPVYCSASVLLVALGYRRNHTPSAQYLASHILHLSHLWDRMDINSTAAFGSIMSNSGRAEDGIELLERVVTELRESSDPRSLNLSNSMCILAHGYHIAGRLKGAEALQEEVLRLRKEILGERHPHTIRASNNLANTYCGLGRLKEAEALQEEVLKLRKEILGERHPATISASNNLANTYRDLGRLKEAEVLREEVLRLRKEILGERHPDTISASNNLALTYYNLGRLKEAEVLQEEVLRLRKEILGERHPDTISASNNLAATYYNLGRLKEAEVLQEEVLRLWKEILGERHPDTIMASNNLAGTYRGLGRLKEAEVLQEEVLRLQKEILGERHPDTISASNNLANTYYNLGRLKEAEVLHEEVLRLRKEILGERHPDTISASNNLALTYRDLGQLKEAEALQEEVLKLRKEILGERHPATISASNNLANTYRDLGRLKEAEVLREEVLRLRKEILGERHPDTISASNNLALTYYNLGRLKEAEVLQEEVLRLRKEILGERHPDTISASNNLALTYYNLGRLKEAEVLQEEGLRLQKEILGERHPDTIGASNNLACTYRDLGRLKEAEVLQEEVLRLQKEILGERHPDTITASSNLALIYRRLGRPKGAELLQEEALRLRKEILGELHPDTITASSNLALTYCDLGRLKEAEVLQEEVLRLRKCQISAQGEEKKV